MRRASLLASLLLHLLVALFWLAPWRRAATPPPEVFLVDLPPAEEKAPGASSGNGAAHAKPSRALPFSALAPVRKERLRAPLPGERAAPSAEEAALSPYAASQDPFAAAPEQAGAFAWIYRKAHYTIGFPAEFIRHEISGNVQARLVFDAAGKFLPSEMSVKADSPYLKVYVFRTLEQTFRQDPIPASLVRWKGQLEVFCFVRFSFAEGQSTVSLGVPPNILGNKLFFARRSVKSKVEKLKWNLGPLHGMFPVPAVSVDMLWFARQAEQIARPRPPVDDLAPYREDPLYYQL